MKKRVFAIFMLFVLLFSCMIITACSDEHEIEKQYEEACDLIEAKKYSDAYGILFAIRDFEPAKEKLKCFSWAPQSVVETTKSGQFDDTTYSFGATGNISFMTDGDDEYDFTYNKDGLLTHGPSLYQDSDLSSSYGLDWLDADVSYIYKDGKLYKASTDDEIKTLTYEYYDNGDLKRVYSEIYNKYDDEDSEKHSTYKFDFEYTYDENGKIKTKTYYGFDNYVENLKTAYTYDELGRVSYCEVNSSAIDYTIRFEYNEFGIEEISYHDNTSSLDIKYVYNKSGALTKVTMNEYHRGELNDTIELEFSSNKLIYSENPFVHERIDHITYNSGESSFNILSEIIW